jgi:hypothetical protein
MTAGEIALLVFIVLVALFAAVQLWPIIVVAVAIYLILRFVIGL